MSTEARKEALRYLFERVVTPLGYKFTPDEELADFLLEQEVKLEQDHGAPFCPARGAAACAPRTCRSAVRASRSTAPTSTR